MPEKLYDANNKTSLSEQDRELIRLIRRIKCGKLRIIVEKGRPVRVELTRKNIEL